MHPTPAYGYLRISNDRGGTSLSPKRQRQLIEEAATRANQTITRWFEDADLSAYRHGVRRPDFETMVQLLRDGAPERSVWVWKLSRQNRRAVNSLGLFDELERLGVVLHSATQGDSKTARIPFRIQAILDEEESREMGDRVATAHQYTTHTLGRYATPRARYGWTYHPGTTRTPGFYEVDETQATVIRAMVDAFHRGYGYRQIAVALNDGSLLGYTPHPFKSDEWAMSSVHRILSSPMLAGYVVHRGQIVGEPSQPPILTVDEWERLQVAMAARAVRGQRGRTAEPQLLVNLARCGGCDGPMGWGGSPRGKVYTCRRHYNGKPCPARASINLKWLDKYVTDWFFARLDETQLGPDLTEPDDLTELRAEIARRERAVDRLQDDHYLHERVSRDVFEAKLAQYSDELDVYREKLQAANRPVMPVDAPLLRTLWNDERTRNGERREMLSLLIDRVVVGSGQSRDGRDPTRVNVYRRRSRHV